MRSEHISYLLTVLEQGSINKASTILHLSRQHLSQILAALEEELGCKIIRRTRTGITLTEEGQAIINDLKQIDNQIKNVVQICRNNSQPFKQSTITQLYFYTVANVNAAKITRAFTYMGEKYPQLSMIMEEKEALSTIEAVSQQANAIGHVVFSPDIAELNYVFPENIALPIQQKLSLTMLAAKDSIYAKRQKTLSLAGLLQHPLILYAPHGMENSHLYMILQQAGRPNIKYIVSNVQAFYALLNNGDCVALGLQNASIAPVENILAIPVRTKLNVYTYLLINKAIQDEPAIRDFQDIYLRYVLS